MSHHLELQEQLFCQEMRDKDRERNRWAKVLWESPCKCETRQHSLGSHMVSERVRGREYDAGRGMSAQFVPKECVCVIGHIWKRFNLIIPCVLSMN